MKVVRPPVSRKKVIIFAHESPSAKEPGTCEKANNSAGIAMAQRIPSTHLSRTKRKAMATFSKNVAGKLDNEAGFRLCMAISGIRFSSPLRLKNIKMPTIEAVNPKINLRGTSFHEMKMVFSDCFLKKRIRKIGEKMITLFSGQIILFSALLDDEGIRYPAEYNCPIARIATQATRPSRRSIQGFAGFSIVSICHDFDFLSSRNHRAQALR